MTSKSTQQVLNELKNKNGDLILTGSPSGVAESYLYSYKKQCNKEKIVTITEVYEVQSQKGILNEMDYLFYIESSLVLNLCEQLLKRNIEEETLRMTRSQMQKNCERFQVGMQRNYKSKYQKGIYLEPILNYIQNKYEWEWLIANFDRPIANADLIQTCMYEFTKDGPSKTIISAYDSSLEQKKEHNSFHIINLSGQKSYQRLKEEAMLILYHLYPILWSHHQTIYRVLSNSELQQCYSNGEYSYEVFINGLRRFYEAYHCIDRKSVV